MSDKVKEFPAQQEPEEVLNHEELIQMYESAVSPLVNLQIPFVLLAPNGQTMGVMTLSNMSMEFKSLMIMNAFLNINHTAASTLEKHVETGAAN